MKFINLLKKELSELINAQMIFSLIFSLAIFMIMGNVMQSVTQEIAEDAVNPKINICDLDDTDYTKSMIESFKEKGSNVTIVSVTNDDYAAALKGSDIKSFVVIPKGFTDELKNGKKPSVISVNKIKSASTFSSFTGGTDGTTSLINSYISYELADQQGVSEENLKIIEAPLSVEDHTVVADKSAKVSSSTILGKISTQNMILPIIVLVLLMLTSQSLIASISNEKIDKTLETLLSTPVTRGSVITAKMLAAAIVALINAGVMMFGFSTYTKGMTSAVTSDLGITQAVTKTLSADEAFRQLGLNLSAMDYAMVGVQLFLTIMICLAISIILGALVNDSKSAQTMLLPIMMMVMIPWLISVFTDVNALPLAAKLIVYAIPFTHTFTSIPNLMFGNTTEFWLGLGYQFVIFLIVMFFALKLFKSDKILTISLNFGQKSRFKKSRKTTED
ncbi:ABC transporter permease [Ruminococcus sp.]|uniref:ABC transporter permease n=1 Tax=Ruminococcus sp. TaxID=41978 RepID=UPI0025CD2CC8|nr:ABC transporter permease [Ruminococcus sp.]